MVGTNAYTKEKHKFYNLTVQDISREGGDFATKVGALCARFVDTAAPVKTQVENGLSKLFNFRCQKIDVSDQSILTLKHLGLHDEERKKTNISDPLTADQRRSGRFLSFMMTVHPDQADPNCNYSRMNFSAGVQLQLYVYGKDASIDNQMKKTPILF